MAKRSSRSPRASARSSKVTSRKPAAAEVEVLEDADGGGMEMGIVIATTVVLLVAILMVDKLQSQIGESGFFF